jgi:hypothetical protein
MYFHWRTQWAARCLGEIVLKSCGAHFGLRDLWKVCQLTRRSLFVYFGAADGTDAVQPQVVFVVHRREGLSQGEGISFPGN